MGYYSLKKLLVIVGGVEFLPAIMVCTSGVLSLVGCRDYFHTNYGLVSAPFLLTNAALTTIGIQCSVSLLLPVCFSNLISIVPSLVAIISGAIGIKCEIVGQNQLKYAFYLCHSLSDLIGCTNNHWNQTKTSNFDLHHYRSKMYDLVLLVGGSLSLPLCLSAAVIALCARNKYKQTKQQYYANASTDDEPKVKRSLAMSEDQLIINAQQKDASTYAKSLSSKIQSNSSINSSNSSKSVTHSEEPK